MGVSDQLRKAIADSGKTNYRIGTDSGINIRTIDHFVTERKPARTDTFDVLCEFFGMELTEKKRSTAGKQAAKKRSTGSRSASAKKRKR